MKQIKAFLTEKKTNKWLRENQDKEIIDIKTGPSGFVIIYEEKFL